MHGDPSLRVLQGLWSLRYCANWRTLQLTAGAAVISRAERVPVPSLSSFENSGWLVASALPGRKPLQAVVSHRLDLETWVPDPGSRVNPAAGPRNGRTAAAEL